MKHRVDYKISEIFESIQGEGRNAGKLSTFIRFAGCNLQCPFCDTDHSIKTILNAQEIKMEIGKFQNKGLLVLTGGEPMLQITPELIKTLQPFFKQISIETNGTVFSDDFLEMIFDPLDVQFTISPKMGKAVKIPPYLWGEVKIVDKGHPKQLEDVLRSAKMNNVPIFVQPIFSTDSQATDLPHCLNLLRQYPSARLSVQMHKYLGMR